jgi:hypothetical protein
MHVLNQHKNLYCRVVEKITGTESVYSCNVTVTIPSPFSRATVPVPSQKETSVPYRSLPFLTDHYHSLPITTIPYRSLPFHTDHYHSLPITTIPYRSLPFHTDHYHSLPITTVPYPSLP